MKKQSPFLHPLFKFPFLHRSLMFWRAVVVAAHLFSPSISPFFESKRKTKKSKEKQSKERQKAVQKEDNVLVLFLFLRVFDPLSVREEHPPFRPFFPSFPSTMYAHMYRQFWCAYRCTFFYCRGKRRAKGWWLRKSAVICLFGAFDPFRVRISMHIFYCRGKRKTKGKWQRRSVDTCLFAHSVSSFPSPCMHIFVAMLDVYKDAHIFLHGKEKSKRKITAFPPPFHLFFVVFDHF